MPLATTLVVAYRLLNDTNKLHLGHHHRPFALPEHTQHAEAGERTIGDKKRDPQRDDDYTSQPASASRGTAGASAGGSNTPASTLRRSSPTRPPIAAPRPGERPAYKLKRSSASTPTTSE